MREFDMTSLPPLEQLDLMQQKLVIYDTLVELGLVPDQKSGRIRHQGDICKVVYYKWQEQIRSLTTTLGIDSLDARLDIHTMQQSYPSLEDIAVLSSLTRRLGKALEVVAILYSNLMRYNEDMLSFSETNEGDTLLGPSVDADSDSMIQRIVRTEDGDTENKVNYEGTWGE